MGEKMVITENTRAIIAALQEAGDAPLTAEDVAERTGLGVKTVNASFNRIKSEAIGCGYREAATQDLGDCRVKEVKLLRLNEKGMALDLNKDVVIKVK